MTGTLLAHRVGCFPRASDEHQDKKLNIVLGPALPGAACKGHAPLFDNLIDGESHPDRIYRHRRALDICETQCPIQEQCHERRLAKPELGEGIWGGELFGRHDRPCPCGKQLPNDVPKGRKYCDDHCRNRYRTRNDRKRPPIRTGTCRCGTTFTTDKKTQIHCSDTCRDEAYLARRAELKRIRRLAQVAA